MINMDIHQEVLHIIEQQEYEIINFLQSLIRIPSITGNEKGIQTYIAKRLEEIGLVVDMWEPNLDRIEKYEGYVPIELGYENRPNVVGVSQGRGGGRSLLFNGHVDVIPAEPITAWKHDPWKGEIENGRVYGRGASDMKGGLAAMTMALDSVLRAGIKLRGDVILEYVVDEEVSGHGTLDCILRGYKADAGISCEAGDLEVQPATTGSMWFEIEIEGKSASMSRIWEAVSAVEKGYRIYQGVSDYQTIRLAEKRHPLYLNPKGSIACFVGVFKAGTYPSSPPDLCTINGRMGILPNENPKEAQKDFINYIHRIAFLDPWLRNHPPKIRFTGRNRST